MIQNSSGIDDPNLVFSGFQQGDIINFPTNCSTFTGFSGTGIPPPIYLNNVSTALPVLQVQLYVIK